MIIAPQQFRWRFKVIEEVKRMEEYARHQEQVNKESTKSMIKVKEFKTVLNVLDNVISALIVLSFLGGLLVLAVASTKGMTPPKLMEFVIIIAPCAVLYALKVIFFGLAHTLVAIALNTEAKSNH